MDEARTRTVPGLRTLEVRPRGGGLSRQRTVHLPRRAVTLPGVPVVPTFILPGSVL
jgi:hypothetical protein